MKLLVAPLMLSFALGAFAAPAQADRRRGDHGAAFEALQEGRVRSFGEIVERVVPAMGRRGFEHIGTEFDPGTAVYRLKFMRGASVIWLEVDGRTGAVIGRRGR